MRQLRVWLARFRGLFQKDARERDFAAEIESHLQMHIDDNIRAGISPEEAQASRINEVGWHGSSKRSLPRSRYHSVSRKRSAGSALCLVIIGLIKSNWRSSPVTELRPQ